MFDLAFTEQKKVDNPELATLVNSAPTFKTTLPLELKFEIDETISDEEKSDKVKY